MTFFRKITSWIRFLLGEKNSPEERTKRRFVQLSEEETACRCRKLIRNSIAIRIGERVSSPLPVGASKFGGCPDLPEGTAWPVSEPCDAAEFRSEARGTLLAEALRQLGLPPEEPPKPGPMTLLAQINLADVHPRDAEKELPERGMLYFFYDPVPEVTWFSQSVGDGRPGIMKVLFEPGDVSGLKRMEWPTALKEEFRFSECPLTFKSEKMLPNDDDFSVYAMDSTDGNVRLAPPENYEEIVASLGIHSQTGRFEKHDRTGEPFLHLLGYADLVQAPIAPELEGTFHAAQKGIPMEAGTDWLLDGAAEWVLLFQFDSIYEEKITRRTGSELCLDDAGRLFFYLRREDLKNRRFDRTLMVLQCG